MNPAVLFELCVDSVASAEAGQTGGAQRVELCANLLEGGVTPSSGTIQLTRERLTIPIHVLIRPRGGDFCYSDSEFEVMVRDIAHARALGVDGIVVGILKPDGTVDVERMRALVDVARPMAITFHRAFDMTRDPHAALETLIDLGVERLLTSGQEISAWEGIELIAKLVQQADGRISIMPGGGINARNVARIIAHSHVAEVHASIRTTENSPMHYRNDRVLMGGGVRPAEYALKTSSSSGVAAFIQAVQAG